MKKKILLLLLSFYQKRIRHFLKPACRFHPTCSEYAKQAIEKHGAGKGLYLGIRRILKCHPWNAGGEDPVP